LNQLLAKTRTLLAAGILMTAFLAGGCGGSSQPKVGDCIDSHQQVVDCKSSSAAMKLVSSQNGPNAIACVQLGKPEVSVKVGNGTFCAQKVH
jgi:hypothetical protein